MIDEYQVGSTTSATVLMSGGLDSYACALLFKNQGLSVTALFINYGQAAATNEAKAARYLAGQLEIPLSEIAIGTNRAFGSGELVGRNLFLISTAIFLGGVHSGILGIGIHAGTPYADCSNEFLEGANSIVAIQTGGRVSVVAPFVGWSKLQIFQYLQAKRAPIDQAYSCESGTIPPCGLCASCRDREALQC